MSLKELANQKSALAVHYDLGEVDLALSIAAALGYLTMDRVSEVAGTMGFLQALHMMAGLEDDDD